MAARPGLPATPARHSSYLLQKGWFPSRRNALAVLDQDPVPTSCCDSASTSSPSSAATTPPSQWSPTPLNRWAWIPPFISHCPSTHDWPRGDSMATATIKHGAHKLLGHNKPSTSDPPPIDNAKCQQEKQFIADFYDNSRPLPPSEIADSPRNKELATSSRQLRIQDFELVKTLGTGRLAIWVPGGKIKDSN